MKAQPEALERVHSIPENHGLTTTDSDAPTTRQLGSEAENENLPEPSTGRNIIVAIGINQYQHQPQLDNPINDAKAVLALFKQHGFEELPGVPSLIADDATRAAIADLPNRLGAELAPEDNLVVFFAGHGDKVERQAPDPAQPSKTYTHRTGYLIPVDGPSDRPGEWIKLDGFLDDLSALPARHIFVILDACKSGIALAEKFRVKGGDQPTAVAALRQLPSRRVLTSARHDEKAAEGGSGSGHSVFAEALIAAVQDRQADKDGDGYIKTVDLFSFIQDRVSDRAKRLFNLRQTPDYGYLPGDGSGDLVISLREGAFNRLVQEALGAMLRHDVPRLATLVAELVAFNPEYPATLYLQLRLKYMQEDFSAAAQFASELRDRGLPAGTLPLSQTELTALSVQLDYWSPLFAIPVGQPPINISLLTGKSHGDLHIAPLDPTGRVYQIENGALAQFQVTNSSEAPVYLYFVAAVPTGRLVIGPLLDPRHWDAPGLEPHGTGVGRVFLVKGLPGSVTETRIFCSSAMCWDLMAPPSIGTRGVSRLDDPVLDNMQMVTVYYQLPDDLTPNVTDLEAIKTADFQAIEAAFADR